MAIQTQRSKPSPHLGQELEAEAAGDASRQGSTGSGEDGRHVGWQATKLGECTMLMFNLDQLSPSA